MKIIDHFLDLLFPPRESERIVKNTKQLVLSEGMNADICYLSRYSNPAVKAAIRENKFFKNRKATLLLAELLKSYTDKHHPTYIIPMPLAKERQNERGYNQVLLVAKQVNIQVLETVLIRTRHTTPQTGLDKHARHKNVKHAFSCINQELVRELTGTIILLDDVITTGATMDEARATLAPHLSPSAQLVCLAIAH